MKTRLLTRAAQNLRLIIAVTCRAATARERIPLMLALMLALPAFAQTPQRATGARPARSGGIPRTSDGKPDFNGVWQSMNAANWNLEDHSAQAGPLPATGAIGAEPGGTGIIEGASTIPYKPDSVEAKGRQLQEPREGRSRG